jgi:hypothetical protein
VTADEFRDQLTRLSEAQLLDACLLSEEAPFVFDADVPRWDSFRDSLSASLNVQRSDIRIVGSGRFGFSMKPLQRLRAFSDTSDIDVVIVNDALFDALWLALLRAAYPRPPLVQKFGGWLAEGRNELYTGWLTPRNIRIDGSIFGRRAQPVLEIRTRWFNALKEASTFSVRRHEDIQGRLYRTWQHAELYHLYSLTELRRTIRDEIVQ